MLTVRNHVFDNLWMSVANDLNRSQRPWAWNSFSPATDVRELEHSYRLELDVPGLGEKDIETVVEGRHLTVRGERKVDEQVQFTRQERAFGKFERLFHLPEDSDAAQIVARVSCGVLTIEIPKRESARARTIAVQAG